jgi:rhamnogalacturonyl hydrolase YesR
MKTTWLGCICFMAALCLMVSNEGCAINRPQNPAPQTPTPQSILKVMQRVADWQLANPSKHKTTDWTQGAGYAGFMALTRISGDAKYRDAMLAMAETNNWKLGSRKYMADDQCVGQAYTELYFLYRDPQMIAPMREKFDWIMANPSTVTNLNIKQPHGTDLWSWCDSLFMAPPAWVRLYAATDDERYLDFAVTNWWRTTDFLYDTNEHLFYRDSSYFNKREANGQKVFWSRGNGWVMGGLVRVLQYLPMNYPDRPRFEQLFKDMAARIVALQQPDGLWHSSLLDPGSYPLKETSGSGFFTYALAWGVNQGLLDRATYEPVVVKAWVALTGCVDADGRLTYVQPVGADPKKFDPNSTEVYGVGAFLLAGSEVYRMSVFEWKHIYEATFAIIPPNSFLSTGHLAVKVTNPSDFRRDCETAEFDINPPALSGNGGVLWFPKGTAKVMDGVSSRILDSQVYATETNYLMPNKLLFQVDLAPHETRTYYILDASALAAVPPPIVKTFARYVPERHDDFAWESDRIAHRMYGPALETWKAEPLTSSGIDVWIKRTRNLVVNQMYGSGVYYNPNGVSQDDYKVGKTRGDGGLGIWQDGKLYVSKNWRTWKVITTGPIRSEFELTYDAWDAGGRKVSETKRISIDANSYFCKAESTFVSDDASPLTVGVGLAERPGTNVIVDAAGPEADGVIAGWENGTGHGLAVQNQNEGWMAYWQPQDFAKGTTGVAIILPKGSVETFTNDKPDMPASAFAPPMHTITEGQPALRDLLATAPAEIGKPFTYYFGACWDLSGDFTNAQQWTDEVKRYVKERDEPLQVTVGN